VPSGGGNVSKHKKRGKKEHSIAREGRGHYTAIRRLPGTKLKNWDAAKGVEERHCVCKGGDPERSHVFASPRVLNTDVPTSRKKKKRTYCKRGENRSDIIFSQRKKIQATRKVLGRRSGKSWSYSKNFGAQGGKKKEKKKKSRLGGEERKVPQSVEGRAGLKRMKGQGGATSDPNRERAEKNEERFMRQKKKKPKHNARLTSWVLSNRREKENKKNKRKGKRRTVCSTEKKSKIPTRAVGRRDERSTKRIFKKNQQKSGQKDEKEKIRERRYATRGKRGRVGNRGPKSTEGGGNLRIPNNLPGGGEKQGAKNASTEKAQRRKEGRGESDLLAEEGTG